MGTVALGYTETQARVEAERCLNCKNQPCVKGCPVGVHIPEFISHIQKSDFKAAVDTIKETNLLPAICGCVCPQEKQCQSFCTVGKIPFLGNIVENFGGNNVAPSMADCTKIIILASAESTNKQRDRKSVV